MGRKKSPVKKAIATTVIVILLLLLGGWIFSMTNLFGCNAGCCSAKVTVSVDPDFNVDDNASYYVGMIGLQTVLIDAWIVNLIKDNNLQSEAEFIAFMEAHYPDAVLSYFGVIWLYFADARFFADADYANVSIVGLSKSICLPGTFFVPYAEVVVNYENGTEFADLEIPLFDPAELENVSLSDLVNATYNMPVKYLIGCGGTLDVEIVSYDSVTEEFVIVVNGQELEVPAS